MARPGICTYETVVVPTCPKCKTSSKLFRPTNPQIDSCGFESYSFQCDGCAALLAGIVDPSDDALLVSLIKPAIDVNTQPSRRIARRNALSVRPEVGSDGSGIGATALSRLPIALLDLMNERLALGDSGDGAKRTNGNG